MGSTIAGEVVVTASSENAWTNWIRMTEDEAVANVRGSGTMTVKLQRRHVDINGIPDTDVTEQTITGTGAFTIKDPDSCEYRLGVPAGGWTSGTMKLSLTLVR